MSAKELPRPGLVRAALAGRITNRQGAEALGLTRRQFQRLKRRFKREGAAALRHESRGRPSRRRLAVTITARVRQLMLTTYQDFNDVHLTEKLREVEGLRISRESVRRIRLGLGRPAKRPRRAPRYHRRRERETSPGALLQVDGSSFDWLDQRGARATLLGVIDDATGAILALHFRPAEDLHGYATLFRELFTTHGLPVAIYGDRLNVFVRNDRHWTLEEELAGAQTPTHLGRIFADLGIAYIPAQSPQAKGRIERLWQTLQDRLTSELRLRALTTLAAAEAYLPAFIADYNRRFARPPAAAPVWRPAPRRLALVFSCRYQRTVAHDNTVRLGARWVQLPPRPYRGSYAGCRVEVRELLDGRLLVLHDGTVLATQAAPAEFILTPRGHSRQARRRSAPPARGAATQSAQDRRSAPGPLPSHPPKSPATTQRAGRRYRPAPDHPWKYAADLHQLRKALRRGVTFSRSSKG